MKFLEENLLEHLQRAEFTKLRTALTKVSFQKGAYICSPDSRDNRVFVVSEGRLRVYLSCEDKEFNLGILTKGDIYSTHTGTFVQALTPAKVLMTDVATFRRQMVSDPEVTKAMVRVLGNILQTSFSIIDGLAFKDVNSRLAALLSTVARKHGRRDEDGAVCIQLDLSVEQIARLIGSSRQTVSALLNDLGRAGLVHKINRGKFTIPNLEALESVGGVFPS